MTPQMRAYFEDVRDKIKLFRKKLLALEEKRESLVSPYLSPLPFHMDIQHKTTNVNRQKKESRGA